MEPTRVIIENLPEPIAWYITWGSVIIAFCALVGLIFSLFWSRRTFIEGKRPYLWILDLAIPQGNALVNICNTVVHKISNAPGRILSIRYNLYKKKNHDKKVLHQKEERNLVRFPDPNSQSSYIFPNFDDHISDLAEDEELWREITVEYGPLSRKDKYNFNKISRYVPGQNKWETVSEEAT